MMAAKRRIHINVADLQVCKKKTGPHPFNTDFNDSRIGNMKDYQFGLRTEVKMEKQFCSERMEMKSWRQRKVVRDNKKPKLRLWNTKKRIQKRWGYISVHPRKAVAVRERWNLFPVFILDASLFCWFVLGLFWRITSCTGGKINLIQAILGKSRESTEMGIHADFIFCRQRLQFSQKQTICVFFTQNNQLQ